MQRGRHNLPIYDGGFRTAGPATHLADAGVTRHCARGAETAPVAGVPGAAQLLRQQQRDRFTSRVSTTEGV